MKRTRYDRPLDGLGRPIERPLKLKRTSHDNLDNYHARDTRPALKWEAPKQDFWRPWCLED